VRISLDGRKAEGEWASVNEFMGTGDGQTVNFSTPFPAKEARGLHVMRDFVILGPENTRRVLGPDGELLRDEPDGYTLSRTSPDAPVVVTFQRAPIIGAHISCSAIGRQPTDKDGKPNGEAFKVLPMSDVISKQLDEKLPPEMRKRNRGGENARLPVVQEFYREAYNRLVVDCWGFTDQDGNAIDFTNLAVKKTLLDTLGALYCGGFAWDRANVLQQERQAGRAKELSD
jgi:hypothetical protein